MKVYSKLVFILIILSNIYPIFGLFFLDWDTLSIFFIYIAEGILLIILAILQILIKYFITWRTEVFLIVPMLFVCFVFLIIEFSIPIGLLTIDLMEASEETFIRFLKNGANQALSGIIIVSLQHIIVLFGSFNREYYQVLDENKFIHNLFKRILFSLIAIILAGLIKYFILGGIVFLSVLILCILEMIISLSMYFSQYQNEDYYQA